MATSSAPVRLPRVELRGLERLMSWRPDAAFKVVHTMLLRGSLPAAIDALAAHAAEAVALTLNRHPRMRMRLVGEAAAVAEIHPRLTLGDVDACKLLVVATVSDNELQSDAAWHAFAQTQVKAPVDRIRAYPFQFHLWVDRAASCARLFLFSDHFTSDGSSGNTILNDLLGFVASLSRGEPVDLSEVPLSESLYERMLLTRTLLHPVLRGVVNVLSRSMLQLAPKFTPLITPREGHQDMQIPPPVNASSMLFASGSRESLEKLLLRARAECTTFFGVLTASILAGCAVAADAPLERKLPVSVSYAMDMRTRATEPIAPDAIGNYAVGATLVGPVRGGGLDLQRQTFWDVAREATEEARATGNSFAPFGLLLVLFDQKYHAQADKSFWDGIEMPHACSADVSVSSVGRYPYATTHAVAEAATLAVESLHYCCAAPFIAPLGQFYVTSVAGGAIGYGFNHHYEPATGSKMLAAVVELMERHAWRVDAKDSMASVVEAARKAMAVRKEEVVDN